MVKSPAKLGEQINNELKAKGMNLYCDIDKNWTATLKGSLKSPSDKETAMGIVKAHAEVKAVKDELQPLINPSDLKLAIDNALLGAGLVDVLADVDENLVATLNGTVSNESEKADAVKIARAVDKVKDVKDNIQVQAVPPPPETAAQPPLPAEQPRQARRPGGEAGRRHQPESATIEPFELEVKINRALQNAGFSRVRARVGKRFNVFLNGRVANESRRAKAMAIAGSFTGVRNVYDKMVLD
jgi:osmotically-inducible protein OsmY